MSLHLEVDLEPIAGYTLVRPLGRGGFGEVWEACAPGNVRVALKFIRLDSHAADVEQRALEIIRDIRHPHLLDVQFAARVEDCLVIAMPLCDESLMDRLRACPIGLPRDELLVYMEELAVAVDFLNETRHRAPDGSLVGVQHRDIKPHNIFLVGGSVRLADLGLAKILAASVASHTGSMSPNYVAPEVIEGQFSQRSDQYSLAVTYYHLRTGKLPFLGESVMQIIYAHVHNAPDLSSLPEAERPVVARALAKRPEERWPSCRDFVLSLVAAARKEHGPTRVPAEPMTKGFAKLPETQTPPPLPPTRIDDGSLSGVGAEKTASDPGFRHLGLGALAAGLAVLAASILIPRFGPTRDRAPHEAMPPAETNPSDKRAAAKSQDAPADRPDPSATARTEKPRPTVPDEPTKPIAKGEPLPAAETSPPVHPEATKSSAAPASRPANSEPTKGELAARTSDLTWSRPGVPGAPVITNTLGMKLVLIPAGEFLMGSPDSDKDADDDEKPQHRVRITRPFYLGVTEVTVGQFRRVVEKTGLRTEAETYGKWGTGWDEATGKFAQDPKYTWRNPGFPQTDEHPVVEVSWNDAIAFCNKLSELEGLRPYYHLGAGSQSGGDGYRLPTEAEWEYACRGGTTTRYASGDDPEILATVGNIADGTAKARFAVWTTIAARDGHVFTAPVGQFRANAFGLYDMHGNVWEWCWDPYKADYYKESPVADPLGPSQAAVRVDRGGSWIADPRYCRSANRHMSRPGNRDYELGFRVARIRSGR